MNNKYEPVFICGLPKSGTTLLLSILDFHPELLVYPIETAFFRLFLPIVQKSTFEEKISLAGSFLFRNFDLFDFKIEKYSEVEPEDRILFVVAKMVQKFTNKMKEIKYRNDGDILSVAVQIFGEEFNIISDKTLRWVEKTPWNENYADKIFEFWPDARCIHIVRDPRDNFISFQRKQPDLTVERFTFNWNKSIKRGFSSQKKYGKNRYLILKYEDLLQDFEKIIYEVVNFIGIRYNDILEKPTQIGKVWEGNSMHNDKFQTISKKPIGRSKELAKKDIRFIETMNVSLMKKLSYEVQYRASMNAYLQTLKWVLRKVL